MYKSTVRKQIQRNVDRLNAGDYSSTLKTFSRNAELRLPGDNSWAGQLRPVPPPGLLPHTTHRGRDEIEAFLQRYVNHGIHMEVEDILVNGPPWAMRAAIRAHSWIAGTDGEPVYTNRVVLFVEARWGKVQIQEDYEDTERVSDLDSRGGDLPVKDT